MNSCVIKNIKKIAPNISAPCQIKTNKPNVMPQNKPPKSEQISLRQVPEIETEIENISRQFDEALLQLQEYSLPNEIPCRETEKETIKSFIEEGLENNGLSHCLCKTDLNL